LLLLSGGIDSPVAGYKISKRGLQLVAVHFWSYPYTSVQAKQKVEKLTLILSNYCPDISLYIVNSTNLQQAIKQYCDDEYIITILRRCMLKIAKQLTIKLNLDCIITGESLGQVASQTLDSLNVSNNAIVDIPILRPLISMDKQEIIEIAKEIDTYQTSILPYEDCCTVFMPKKPIIHPTRDRAILNENKIPNLNELIDEAVNQTLQTTNQKIVKQLN
ncbi:MAG: 7-cyano-7-deazaguanine synthase, partial [Firmicutes bacterium]|nr:7-cyano-7-deazaguanine synthase [Bacillota bacterium]